GQHTGAAVVEINLECFWRHEASVAHDQLGASRLVIVQVRVDLALNHIALAFDDGRHVGGDWTGHHAEARALTRQVCDPGAPDLVLPRQAGDVWTRAGDPGALDDGGPPSRLRHVPSQQLAALAATEDQDVELFRSRHDRLRVAALPLRGVGDYTPCSWT